MKVPSEDYHRLHVRALKPPPRGLDALAYHGVGLAGRIGGRRKKLEALTDLVQSHAKAMETLSDRHLREQLERYRTAYLRGRGDREGQIDKALAAICEAAFRTIGLRPYPVQILGALTLEHNCLAEMATGEGKTLTASLAAVLAGWTGMPCHVLTVNDYLAKRDANWFKPLYQFCGLHAACVTEEMDPDLRRVQYEQPIVYTTSKELLADFLRDRLRLQRVADPQRRLIRHLLKPAASAREGLVLRGLHTAIVDEADSLLIDEAVTPLIIAQPRENPLLKEAVTAAGELIHDLKVDEHYTVDMRYRELKLTDEGMDAVALRTDKLPPVWRGPIRSRELVEQALTARDLFLRDTHYVLRHEKVQIVDEFTGRIMANRSWSEGLHQAVEAKENLEITEPNETVARMSFQRFFRLFPRLAGMTGTAAEARKPLWHIYGLPIVRIPTHRPVQRTVLPERIFPERLEKWEAVADEVARLHAENRPVLIGTRSVRFSEELAAELALRGLQHNLLNAVRHEEEARIVAEAGLPGKITIATNMAGRGTDIKLGHGVAEAGGLHVIATERHESGRIDRQLFGRCARQGDPGSVQVFVSLDDELFRRFLPETIRKGLANNPNRTAVLSSLNAAQKSAERQAFRRLGSVLATDNWLDESLSFATET
jgi:preprotein translocase subunit SecA